MNKIWGILIVFLFINCTTQNFVPPRPLLKGENELRVSLNLSGNNFSTYSIQFSMFHGLTDQDVIGTSLNNFVYFLPSHISMAHYWDQNNSFYNMQFHMNDLFATNYNPSIEFDLGYSNFYSSTYNTVKIGVGYYGTPLLYKMIDVSVTKHKFVSILGYRVQHKMLYADVQLIKGMTDYFIRYYKDNYKKRPTVSEKYQKYSDNIKYTQQEFEHNNVEQIFSDLNEYKIALKNGDTLLVTQRPPYSDWIGGGFKFLSLSAYNASQNHRMYWIYWQNRYEKDETPIMLELNMSKIIANYKNGGDLLLIEDQSLSEKTIQYNKCLWNDLIFSIGRVEYQNH